MTNQERNIRLAELLGYEFRKSTFNSSIFIKDNEDNHHSEFNYCINWNDLMPLVVEHEISFLYIPQLKRWSAIADGVYTSSDNKDPCITLVDCLISVLEAKQINPTQE